MRRPRSPLDNERDDDEEEPGLSSLSTSLPSSSPITIGRSNGDDSDESLSRSMPARGIIDMPPRRPEEEEENEHDADSQDMLTSPGGPSGKTTVIGGNPALK